MIEQSNVIVALALQVIALIAALVTVARDRRGGRALVDSMKRWRNREAASVAVPLPAELHPAATRLTEALSEQTDMDRAAVDAMGDLALGGPQPGPLVNTFGSLALVLSALSPFVTAMFGAALAAAALRPPADARAYIVLLDQVPAAFEAVRTGAVQSALLLTSALFVLAIRWWLVRPEVRHARMMWALLDAARAAEPNLRAPKTAGLARNASPSLGLGPAAVAALSFVVTTAGAWFLLIHAAPVRAANDAPPRPLEWPSKRTVSGADGVKTYEPRFPGGTPLPSDPWASLIVTMEGVHITEHDLLNLEQGRLDESELERAPFARVLNPHRAQDGGLELFVLAHRTVPMASLVKIGTHLTSIGLRAMHLIVGREVRKKSVQSGLTLVLARDKDPKVRLTVSNRAVSVVDGKTNPTFPLSAADWATQVRKTVREATGVSSDGPIVMDVGVKIDGDVSYETVVAVLVAAEGTCPIAQQCALPGLGYRFNLIR